MIAFPSGARVWLATGHTDMRKGFGSLAVLVQEEFKRDPHAGDLWVFRGKRGDLIKLIWHDGDGACLFTRRLERGRFLWPSIVMRTFAPNAIVIEAGAGDGAKAETGAIADSGSLASNATINGTKARASRVAATCRRQRYSRLTSTPAARAISVTTASGSSIAATSWAFSAMLQRRRRSTDVITSTRFMAT